jgi:thymidylate synthase (FAD)
MNLIRPSFEIMEVMGSPTRGLDSGHQALKLIELAGRTCYKSETNITADSSERFVKARVGGHESVLEHSAMTVRFICDRGVTHELVRHRLCAFSQESTRYCNYKGGVTFIIPPWVDTKERNVEYSNIEGVYYDQIEGFIEDTWITAMCKCEENYLMLLDEDWTPQQARSVLPNSTKTEIVVTTNFREWRHIFKLRCDKAAHPQMQEIMRPLLDKCKELIPVIFDDITY